MKTSVGFLLAVTAGLLGGGRAAAHFLFLHITPPAEAGRGAEVYFSDQATAGDPRFIAKIAHTELWQQDGPDRFRPLHVQAGADRLRAHLPSSGPVAVVGLCTYGVLARPQQTPFLLRYYPKAVAGGPAELNRLQQGTPKLPLEIRATFEGDRVGLVLLSGGSPVPRAEFHTVDAGLKGQTLTADAEGRAWWQPSAPGRYSVYTPVITKAAGEYKGQKFEEIREYPTLAFRWPLVATGEDAEAVALFEKAVATRASWRDFPGFTAQFRGRVDGRAIEGQVTVAADGQVTVETDEEAVAPWVQEQLESIAMHRAAGPSGDRPRPVLRFGDDDADHPLGRLLVFDRGQFASSYRVQDDQIRVVNRHLGSRDMTITVVENERNADGRFLPRTYTVQYWDADSGELVKAETVHQRWQRVGRWDLPAAHTVTEAGRGGLAVRSLTLTGHQLLPAR